jgi:hypothetical protein
MGNIASLSSGKGSRSLKLTRNSAEAPIQSPIQGLLVALSLDVKT